MLRAGAAAAARSFLVGCGRQRRRTSGAPAGAPGPSLSNFGEPPSYGSSKRSKRSCGAATRRSHKPSMCRPKWAVYDCLPVVGKAARLVREITRKETAVYRCSYYFHSTNGPQKPFHECCAAAHAVSSCGDPREGENAPCCAREICCVIAATRVGFAIATLWCSVGSVSKLNKQPPPSLSAPQPSSYHCS